MKQLGELEVKDYMTLQAVVVDDTEKLTHAIGLMERNRTSVLPVVNNQGEIVGILSTSDLVGIIHELQADISALPHVTEKTQEFLLQMLIEQGDSTFVCDVMTSPVETVTENDNLVIAARKINEHNYHHLPVVDDEGRPIGILSTSDFVQAFADHGASMAG